MTKIQHTSLMPGAGLLTLGEGPATRRALVGVPPCFKVLQRTRTPSPNTFVVPDVAFRNGVPQVALEFFVYDDLFVPRDGKPGKAFRPFDPSERLVVIGTAEQLARVRRVTEVTLFGFSPDEMRAWRDGNGRPALRESDIDTLERFAA